MKKDDVKALALSLGLSGEVVKLDGIKANPDNPRVLRDEKFALLKKSIEEFPKMLALRPIVTDADGVVLGGNMRLRALQDLGYNYVPAEWVKNADTLTEDERRQFIIKDNASFGEWDYDALANDWNDDDLRLWGVDVWNTDPISDEEVAALFENAGEQKEKPLVLSVEIPKEYEGNVEDIKEAVRVTLGEWKGCAVR